jgi:hypothetical protein
MNDELRPNDTGNRVMAQTWYAAIKSYLHSFACRPSQGIAAG